MRRTNAGEASIAAKRAHGAAHCLGEAGGAHALAGHVADEDRDVAVVEQEDVAEVAAHELGLVGRLRDDAQLEPRDRGQRVEEVLLQRGRDTLLVLVQAGVLERRRDHDGQLAGKIDRLQVEPHGSFMVIEEDHAEDLVARDQRYAQDGTHAEAPLDLRDAARGRSRSRRWPRDGAHRRP